GDAPKKILCLANKPLTTNRRFYRHTRTLASWGHDITVMALALPDPELKIEEIRYFEMPPLEENESQGAPLAGVSKVLAK
ncbi:MAG: hypothetical protein MI743_14100, partial [Sneathiellales bacterium]|nr:hypothetical protein [Sneathiellales bacterium]